MIYSDILFAGQILLACVLFAAGIFLQFKALKAKEHFRTQLMISGWGYVLMAFIVVN